MSQNESIDPNSQDLLEEDVMTVTLTLENDEVLECEVLAIFPIEDKQYIALVPLEEDEAEDEELDVFLYRFIPPVEEDGDPTLENINDDEYDAVVEAFYELQEDDFDDEDSDTE